VYTLKRLELAMTAASAALWDSSISHGRIVDGRVFWSPQASAVFRTQLPATESFRRFLHRVHDADRERIVLEMQAGIDSGAGYHVEYRLNPDTQPDAWIAARASILKDAAGAPIRTLGLVSDISDQVSRERKFEENEKIAQVTLQAIGEGVITIAADGDIRLMNRAAEAMTGWSNESAAGQPVQAVAQLVDEDGVAPAEHLAVRCMRQGQPIALSAHDCLVGSEGRMVDAAGCAAPIWSRESAVSGAVLVLRDVSHERRLRKRLSWQASHDELTGMLNRSAFELAVGHALHSAKAEGNCHALFYMDLDRFKIVNDTCGHLAGDTLLEQLSGLLRTSMRDSDLVARLGGDEFGALLSRCPMEQAEEIAETVRAKVNEFRFRWCDQAFEVGVSIGIAGITGDSISTSDVLNAADQACYLAKARGRNRVHVYQDSDALLVQRKDQMKWLPRLHEALEQQRFQLFTMPIAPLNDEGSLHEEVLLRMTDQKGKLIMPGAFIPAAERYSMIQSIDRWVIGTLCKHLAAGTGNHASDRSATPARTFSINLSGSSVGDEALINFVFDTFLTHHISPECICFEITETAVVANLSKAQEFIAKLRASGCQFSLDDFGSGLSSFAYLKDLPVDYLKIDGVFVRDITTNSVNCALVKAISDIGHVMRMRTVAEYVEKPETLALIAQLGLDYAQGYAVGKARPLAPHL
jgi:diguanylate cyclase (GGDEF)-like protein/PAS domain S-box-containing protein